MDGDRLEEKNGIAHNNSMFGQHVYYKGRIYFYMVFQGIQSFDIASETYDKITDQLADNVNLPIPSTNDELLELKPNYVNKQ